MALLWSEEQTLLRETARSFLDERSPISELRRLRDEAEVDSAHDGFDRKLWRDMAELGWAGVPWPEALGGAGLGHAELGAVLLECGRSLAATPLLASVTLGGNAIELAGSEAQRERWLPPVCAGDRLLAMALQEGPHHAPYRVGTRAERSGSSGWRIQGEKHFVLDGHVADSLVVVARVSGAEDERQGLGLFVVERSAADVEVTRTTMVDGRNAANLTLRSVAAEALGTPGEAAAVIDSVLDRATAVLCAEMLGGAEAAFARTLEYLKIREQFGVPIGSFQALKHRAAKMFIELELSRTAVLEALQAVDAADAAVDPSVRGQLVSIAKARLSDAAFLIGNEGVQLHGGIGVTDEEDIGLFMKRFRVQQRTLGDAGFHRDRYASLRGY